MVRLGKHALFAALFLASCAVDRSAIGGDDDDASSGGSGAASGTGGFGGVGGSGASGGFGGAGGVGGTGGVGIVDAAVDATIQGYEPGAVGAPCTNDTECAAGGLQRTCFAEDAFAGLLTLPGGYCATLCDPFAPQACEPGASCITIPTFPPVPVCMRTCASASDCREQAGYSCNMPFTSTSSVCSLVL